MPRVPVAPVLALAVTAISAAAVLVRLAPEAGPLGAAFGRQLLGALVLAPTLWRAPLRLELRHWAMLAFASACLGVHFVVWFASLEHIGVLRSTVLVCLTPIWVGLLEGVVLREVPHRSFWVGVGLAVAGIALMLGVMGTGLGAPPTWEGDGAALLGGVLAASYLVTSRAVRPRVAIGPYGALLFGGAALWLLPGVAAAGFPMIGWSAWTWGIVALMALGPQLLGHLGLNYAVRYVPAARVSALILLEPVGAALLAALVLDENPTRDEMVGSAVVLLGVAIAVRR